MSLVCQISKVTYILLKGRKIANRMEPERKKLKRMVERPNKKHGRKERQCEAMLQLLEECKKEHGDTVVPIAYVQNNKELGKWVTIQRSLLKSKNLSDCRAEMLGPIGKATREWMTFHKSLVAHKEEHGGSTSVPPRYLKNRKLGFWNKFRKNQLSTIEVNLLESIGFS